MPKKRFSAEQIVKLLRQIEVLMVQGKSAPEACRDAGISQQMRASSSSVRPKKSLITSVSARVTGRRMCYNLYEGG